MDVYEYNTIPIIPTVNRPIPSYNAYNTAQLWLHFRPKQNLFFLSSQALLLSRGLSQQLRGRLPLSRHSVRFHPGRPGLTRLVSQPRLTFLSLVRLLSLSPFFFTLSSIGLSFSLLLSFLLSVLFSSFSSALLSFSCRFPCVNAVSSLRITNSRFPPLASSVSRRIFPAKDRNCLLSFFLFLRLFLVLYLSFFYPSFTTLIIRFLPLQPLGLLVYTECSLTILHEITY